MIPYESLINRSLLIQDHMVMGELAIVTDTHCNNRTVAFILPNLRATNEEGEFTGRVYLNVFCMGKKDIITKEIWKGSWEDIHYQSTHNWMTLFSITSDQVIQPFNRTIPKHRSTLQQYYSTPYHEPWIHYNSIPKKDMPLYLGLSDSLDAEIAFRLNTDW